ncbi:MAG: hypothetical protein WEC15_02945 [Flavobacteriales bacterium]
MRPILAILAATVWISVNEFLRNQLVLIDHWTGHYAAMGLTFPGEPVNGAVWGLWSLAFAVAIFVMARRFNLLETAALAWSVGFVLMWLVVGNMAVLPFSVLPYAIPWSMVEAFGAVWLVKKLG